MSIEEKSQQMVAENNRQAEAAYNAYQGYNFALQFPYNDLGSTEKERWQAVAIAVMNSRVTVLKREEKK